MRKTDANNSTAPAPLSLTASLLLLLTLSTPAPAASASVPATGIAAIATAAMRASSLEITLPKAANLGGGAAGGSYSASLGTVTVVDSRPGIPPWTATVAATDLTTGGSPAQTIAKANVAYWSGPTTASSGAGSRVPGQAAAADKIPLTASVIAFRGRKGAAATSTSWQPTLIITVPASAAAGVYTGVITHSIA